MPKRDMTKCNHNFDCGSLRNRVEKGRAINVVLIVRGLSAQIEAHIISTATDSYRSSSMCIFLLLFSDGSVIFKSLFTVKWLKFASIISMWLNITIQTPKNRAFDPNWFSDNFANIWKRYQNTSVYGFTKYFKIIINFYTYHNSNQKWEN